MSNIKPIKPEKHGRIAGGWWKSTESKAVLRGGERREEQTAK